jgi:sugar lactone lactonase YvrE
VKFDVLSEHRSRLGESPCWVDDEAALTYTDVHAGMLCRWSAQDGLRTRKIAERLSFAIPGKNGALLFGLRHGLAALADPLATADGDLQPSVAVEADMPTTSLNDARVDAAGRLWFGTIERQDRKPICHIYSWSPDRGLVAQVGGVSLSNGLQFSPDNKTMYFVDSWLQRLDAFDFDLAEGKLSNRRVVAEIPSEQGMPDGINVDAEGYVYVALFGGGRLHRYAPDGRLDREIAVPVTYPTSCTFGGPDLKTLYITSANPDHSASGPLRHAETAMETDPALEGAVLVAEIDVAGRPSPAFPHPVSAVAAR